MSHTYTYATLEISPEAYDEIAAKMRAAGYDHAFDTETGAISMQGIGLVRAAPEPGYTPDEDGRLHCVCEMRDAPAASMCAGCPRREKHVERDLACWAAVLELRSEEAEWVGIYPPNADFNGHKDYAIECFGAWTGWAERRFEGNTLLEALQSAVAAKRDAEAKAG